MNQLWIAVMSRLRPMWPPRANSRDSAPASPAPRTTDSWATVLSRLVLGFMRKPQHHAGFSGVDKDHVPAVVLQRKDVRKYEFSVSLGSFSWKVRILRTVEMKAFISFLQIFHNRRSPSPLTILDPFVLFIITFSPEDPTPTIPVVLLGSDNGLIGFLCLCIALEDSQSRHLSSLDLSQNASQTWPRISSVIFVSDSKAPRARRSEVCAAQWIQAWKFWIGCAVPTPNDHAFSQHLHLLIFPLWSSQKRLWSPSVTFGLRLVYLFFSAFISDRIRLEKYLRSDERIHVFPHSRRLGFLKW